MGCFDLDLISRREQAMDRADKAVDKAWPARTGDTYVREMQTVANELKSIAAAMGTSGCAAIERSRAFRYLGSVYSDLAPALGNDMYSQAMEAYRLAEALLRDDGDPLERAKLDFNFGNALRQMDANNSAQLQEAERRFLAARRVFVDRSPQHLAAIDEALSSTRSLLKVAPLAQTIECNRLDLEKLESQIAAGGNVAEIAEKFKDMQQRGGGVAGLSAAVQRAVSDLPDNAKGDDRFNELTAQMNQLASMVQKGESVLNTGDEQVMQKLRERLNAEAQAGRLTADRAKTLSDLLDDFGKTLGNGDQDIQGLMNQLQGMRSKTERQFVHLHYLSHGIDRPPKGSRADQLVEMCWQLRLYLAEEMTRPNKGQEESKQVLDLIVRSTGIDKRIYEAGADDGRAVVVDKEAFRPFSLDVRSFSLRHQPLLARPIWTGARVPIDPCAVFFSGSSKVRQQVEKACLRLGLDLLSASKGEAISSANWKHLQKASVAVFDLAVQAGPARAAVAYELGIARTLGKSVAILARPDYEIPFDVDMDPVLLSGSANDVNLLADTLDRALVWTMQHPRSKAIGNTIDKALRDYGACHDDIYVAQTLKHLQQQKTSPDPVSVNAALNTLVSHLHDDRLMLMHPVWPPTYPETEKKRLFHVMPFRPDWADAAAKAVEAACLESGAVYVRGDRVSDPNIIRSIWDEISLATHVLVDLTGFNANAALELGIAHTLGRPTLMVGQGDTVRKLFPMIAKLRFSSYGKVTDGRLGTLVNTLLA